MNVWATGRLGRRGEQKALSMECVEINMHRWAACVTLASLLLAGCSSPASDLDDNLAAGAPDAAPPVVDAFSMPMSASDCLELGVVILVSMAHAQSQLPEGFVAADAQAFFGSPTPFNRAAVFLTNTRCDTTDLAEAGLTEALVGITIEDPGLPANGTATVHFYEPARGTDTPAMRLLMDRVGWATQADSIQSTAAFVPLVQGSGVVSNNGTAVYDMAVRASPMPATFSGTYRWWQQTPLGVGLFDYTLSVDGYIGHATCNIAPGAVAARAAGTTTCTDANSVGVIAPGLSFEGGFQWLGLV